MGFTRKDPNEDAVQWKQLQRQLGGSEETNEVDPTLLRGLDGELVDDALESESENEEEAQTRPEAPDTRAAARAPSHPIPRRSSEALAELRLGDIKKAAERMRRLKKASVDPSRTYRAGKRVFDPTLQKFGTVVYSSEGYVRIQHPGGDESAHGKPPLEDRRNFVRANFERMDNRTMADILGISVHTMRRLCHEYGLKRHGQPKAKKSA